ncbi:DNA-binding response regulator [Rhodoferax koreense]|uniref:DNA-binding response regulator n=1 Tax=Rhodoferax koreensis TaxID=1842727 RepID=A0A1P8JZ98_9BURK|nr:response regulator transcription factor [Rhodoferax koreense]APW39076.1 DNA-binding response regulator [Rhodoferax koreense]
MKPQSQILVVDDDEGITSLLRDYLARFDFGTHAAADGHAMRAQLASQPIDLVVLDLMLPGTDGLTLARELRQRSTIPIIMLTARAGAVERVVGLEVGADDYMAKPFEPRELVARIQTVLRRSVARNDPTPDGVGGDVVRFDGWSMLRHERQLKSPTGMVVPLSNAEFRLLSIFLGAPRRVFAREQLMAQARGRSMDGYERSIDLLVSRLRQKLSEDPQNPSMIKTVRGVGYMFDSQTVQSTAAWHSSGL